MSRLRSLLLVALASSLDLASAFAPSALGTAARRSDATVMGDADARSVEIEESITSGTSAEASLEPSAWRSLALGMALGVFAAFCVARPAMALPNLAKGEEIFLGNCAACHAAGRNAVQPDKTLQKAALEQYGMYDVDRIKYQVTNGKNAMPAFGERVSSQDIDDVSNYIMVMAEKGWTSSS
eukprot:CAMPEP_0183388766 /NCGR_PEP_ID=MMETSP0370-20130417/4375_1 /TAXON_ID=268820 /ORGANISM="Peridinium aciculiferum, Strain PAER-2" /LENGTH=181 /DNA_ID=CAMNT_0025567819 /DNA_START=96 /DNA_END=641 /DNA_ORIENTATION=-